jgi:hypothetical protein
MLLLLLLSFFAAPVAGAASPLSSYRLNHPARNEIQAVSRFFEVAGRAGDRFEVLVPAAQAALLHLLAPEAVLEEADTGLALRRKLEGYRALASDYRYHSLAEVNAWMRNAAAIRPELAEVVSYGSSRGGHPLLALRLANKALPEPKPAVMITAATHGDEVITTEVLMNLVDRLLQGYGGDPRFTGLLDRLDLYFVPVVNPDGFAERERYETGEDPNRSYPYPEEPGRTPTPSIGALMKFFEGHSFAGSLDYHAYGEMVMYPWAYTHSSIPADYAGRFHALAASMAENNRYDFGPISDVIYIAPGSSADYYFWKTKSTSFAIEMGQSKAPRPKEIPAYADVQAEPLWRFLESF